MTWLNLPRENRPTYMWNIDEIVENQLLLYSHKKILDNLTQYR